MAVADEACANGDITVRNPWPGQNVMVVDGSGATVLSGRNGATLTIPARRRGGPPGRRN
ncbi:hypothetical protein [Streptomyces sp. NPDC005859]|uniref:hypothetical protein n=1 Tax=Streptomyces sp. NPDC005859 TaxID=3157170 RepID=UPI0033EBF1D2